MGVVWRRWEASRRIHWREAVISERLHTLRGWVGGGVHQHARSRWCARCVITIIMFACCTACIIYVIIIIADITSSPCSSLSNPHSTLHIIFIIMWNIPVIVITYHGALKETQVAVKFQWLKSLCVIVRHVFGRVRRWTPTGKALARFCSTKVPSL